MSASKLVVLHNHTALRQASREMMHDSVDMRALVTSVVDTVVDSGMRVKPTPISEIIGITPEEAEIWAEDISQKFHLWANSKQSHRSRINNYYQNQRFYQLQKQRDGDVFVRLYYGREKDTFSPLQIDFIDPNQIKGYGYTSTYYNPQKDDGIVRDSAGREIGYKIYNYNTITGEYTETTIPAVGEKSGRYFMLHGFNPEYPGQGRGYPPLTHALHEFEQLTDFKVATVQKAIQQASIVMAVMNDKKDPSNPMIGRVAGPMPTYGQPPQEATDGDMESQPIINYTSMPEATFTQPGVGVFNLTEGDRLEYLKDTSPSNQFDVFVNSFFGSIVSSTGWSVETVLKKFNNNYSASRATLILCWRVANIERNEQNSDFDNPIYEMWLSEEIAAGRVQARGWTDPLIRAAWLCAEWAGAPMPNIDPAKMAVADLAYVQMGAQTLDDVARNFNGSSGKANRIKLKRQWEELPEPMLPVAPIYRTEDESVEKSKDKNDDDMEAVARDDMITVKTPVSDVEFKVKKRNVKKTAKYTDYDGIEKQIEIFEEEV